MIVSHIASLMPTIFVFHNKRTRGGEETLSKQRKYYKENVNITYFMSSCSN